MPVTLGSKANITIQVGDDLSFTVRPEDYGDFLTTSAFAGQFDYKSENSGFACHLYHVMRRITEWDGVLLPDGSPAPCTEATKMQLFAERKDLLPEIAAKLLEREADLRKN